MPELTATYSPDDNKLRIYTSTRLDGATYASVKAAGFIWAPKQDLFVAPAWTPDREDLLLNLAGDIGDDDTSLADRAEERAERFDGYRENRARDAEQARQGVSAIADNIPLGQPILVGHHSERHARRDAERIENGMRLAVRMWQTSQYWQSRAAGAIRHAKYKERPDVRARRIKGLEADRRKRDKEQAEARRWIQMWAQLNDPHKDGSPCDDALRLKRATWIANYSHVSLAATDDRPYGDSLWSALDKGRITPRAAQLLALKVHAMTIQHTRRWIAHLDHRLAYERAMLAEAGGTITDRTEYPIVPGGHVLIGAEWLTVIRVNRSEGRIVSVTTNARYVRVKGIELVKEYQPPSAADARAVTAAKRLPPLVNVDTPDTLRMTAAEYKRRPTDYRSTRTIAATAEHGAYRQRHAFKPGGGYTVAPVFITDVKVTPIPSQNDSPNPPPLPRMRVERDANTAQPTGQAPPPEAAAFESMRESLRHGVAVVTAPQLFPTPVDVARRLVELADLHPGMTILEPSAGTGRLIDAAALSPWEWSGRVVAVEQNAALASGLRAKYKPEHVDVRCADFLGCNGDLGTFDRILLNPPFENADDIRHILRARRMLKPGGRLAGICANGPRQQAELRHLAVTWIELPAGTFPGTSVRAAIVVMSAP